MSEESKSIIAARVTNIRARLTGNMLIIMALVALTGILFFVALSDLDQALSVLEEAVARLPSDSYPLAPALAEAKAASHAVRVVPMVWGGVIAAALLGTTAIAIGSIVQSIVFGLGNSLMLNMTAKLLGG